MSWYNPFSWGRDDDDDGPDPLDADDERNYVLDEEHSEPRNLFEYYEPSEYDNIPHDYEPY